MARAVEAVGVRPFSDGFFAVGPDEPDAVAVALLAGRDAQLICELEEDAVEEPPSFAPTYPILRSG